MRRRMMRSTRTDTLLPDTPLLRSVDGGTMIGNTDLIRGNLENGGTVIFDQNKDGIFAGGVSGLFSFWGFMIKRGEGALTLGGSNNLDWRVEEGALVARRSEEHTSALQSLMRISYADFCLTKT